MGGQNTVEYHRLVVDVCHVSCSFDFVVATLMIPGEFGGRAMPE